MDNTLIPLQLQNEEFRFVLLGKGEKGKTPFEKDWTNKGYRFDDFKLINHIEKDNNFGVIGGYGRLRILDIDDKTLAEELLTNLNTYTIKTGGGGMHFYFLSDYKNNHVLINELGELRANNYQVVSAPCRHPNGKNYEIIKNVPIAEISSDDLFNIIKPFLREEQEVTKITFNGKDTSGSGLEYRRVLAMIREGKSREVIYKEMGKYYKKWANAGEDYRDLTYNKAFDYFLQEQKTKGIGSVVSSFLDKRELAKKVMDIQPFFFDTSEIWWLWNYNNFCWEIKDNTDILNMISDKSTARTIPSREKAEILEALRQVGRKHKPKEALKTWIQFKNRIYDIKNNTEFEATPKYFITNPIDWELGESEETSVMDKLFEEWVGKENVKVLYEIIAYCTLAHMPIHRIFCLIGDGLNGKGTFLRLIEKFIGNGNITASDFDLLSTNRFESSKLYKKLVCMMGDIDKSIFSKTAWVKRITGDDLCRVEFKQKNSIDEHLYAKPLIACNTLPETTDKTAGFYRRWCIVEFPNRFNEQKDILEIIPEKEYNNLARKSLGVLRGVLGVGGFTKEGDIEFKKEKYEKHSNPLDKFIKENCVKKSDGYIVFADFHEQFIEYLKGEGGRIQGKNELGKGIRNRGYDMKVRKFTDAYSNETTKMCVFGVKWEDESNIVGQIPFEV